MAVGNHALSVGPGRGTKWQQGATRPPGRRCPLKSRQASTFEKELRRANVSIAITAPRHLYPLCTGPRLSTGVQGQFLVDFLPPGEKNGQWSRGGSSVSILHFLAAFLLAVKAAPAAANAQAIWVGKIIILTEDATIGPIDRSAVLASLDELAYKVLGEQDSLIQVRTPHGVVGWFEKTKAVPLEEAVVFFTERIKQNPNDADAYFKRASSWTIMGRPDPAIKDFDEAIRLDPKRPGIYVLRGNAWSRKKEYDKAIADYHEALRLEPKFARVYFNLGNAWRMKKDYDRAIDEYSRALGQEPNLADAYNNRGLCFAAKKEYDRAIVDYDQALRQNPNHFQAYYNRGDAWGHKNDFDKAIADFGEAIRLNPKWLTPYFARAKAWRLQKDFGKALADYDAMVRLEPKNAEVYFQRARALSFMKDYPKALADYDQTLKLDPKHFDAYLWRGQVWFALADYDKAIDDFGAVIRLEQKHVEAYLYRALAWAKKKDYEKALSELENAVRIDPKDASVQNQIAWIRATCPEARWRDGKKAVEAGQRAVELKKGNAGFVDTLAAAYAEAGDFEQAVSLQEQVLQDPRFQNNEGARRRLELYRNKMAFRDERGRSAAARLDGHRSRQVLRLAPNAPSAGLWRPAQEFGNGDERVRLNALAERLPVKVARDSPRHGGEILEKAGRRTIELEDAGRFLAADTGQSLAVGRMGIE
jgi:tetratricopeptide (TPR) repeat protein